MNSSPIAAERGQVRSQDPSDPSHLPPCESIVLAQSGRATRTAQIEDRLAAVSYEVNMCGTMIVRIDHNPQTVDLENGRHVLPQTQSLGNPWSGDGLTH
jgi:hypothetical protein